MTRVLIVSKMRLFREGLAQALTLVEPVEVVGQHSDRAATLASLRDANVDAVLLDMSTADSRLLARDIKATAPATPVVGLGVPESEVEILSCVEAGVGAYVTLDESLKDLMVAVKSAIRGELVCSPRVAGSLVRRVAALSAERGAILPERSLTVRECEIGGLLRQHLSNKEIAARLGIEVATVKNHVHNLLDKLQVHKRIDAVRLLARVLP